MKRVQRAKGSGGGGGRAVGVMTHDREEERDLCLEGIEELEGVFN